MKIKSALISVYHKEGLNDILKVLEAQGTEILSTGGTQKYIEELGYEVKSVESLTGYPSILGGRVKTLHPVVFGGILAVRREDHLGELDTHKIAPIDLVIVDLYPFSETVKQTAEHRDIIEKIDIGGISLIRAAAKNYQDVAVVSHRGQYDAVAQMLSEQNGELTLEQRMKLAREAFNTSTEQDLEIINYLNTQISEPNEVFRKGSQPAKALRYGENPHQSAQFYGPLEEVFEQWHGKELSYNNLVDVDAAIRLMAEFWEDKPTAAVLKHTNSCGLASRDQLSDAWEAALAGDPISAFGGIFIVNSEVDLKTAQSMNKLFFEVIIAPSFSAEALEVLKKKKKRIILKLKNPYMARESYKQLLNGVIVQEYDGLMETEEDLKTVSKKEATSAEVKDLLFANKAVKHLKSNAIALVKDEQLVGMGCGQTSRVDALKQAIAKAQNLNLELKGAVMASDAFFPFPDCVEIADKAGITAVIQPGGSIKDQASIDYCDEHNMSMVMTGNRHFKH